MPGVSHVAPVALLGALLTVAANAAAAQERHGAAPAPNRLALEIIYHKERPPSYQPVPGPEVRNGGAWYALFGRVPSHQPPAGSLPVRAVDVRSRAEGDAVRVTVSVFLGVRHHEKQEPVATYLVREGEKVSAGELTQFGVEPFEIKVVRVVAAPTAPPPVLSEAGSITVAGTAINDTMFPSYRVSLRNHSGRAVLALGVEVWGGGRRRITSMPQGEDGRPLIPAGEVAEIFVAGVHEAQQGAPDVYAPGSPADQRVVIAAAVFDDGWFEGSAATAADFRGFAAGRKAQIARLLPLLQDALDSTGRGAPSEAARLRERVSSLNSDVHPAVVQELQRALPATGPRTPEGWKAAVGAAMNGVKTEFIRKLEEFEKGGAATADAGAFRAFLRANKERYERWLSRL